MPMGINLKILLALKKIALLYVFLLLLSLVFYMTVGSNSNDELSIKFMGCVMSEPAPIGGVFCEDTIFGSFKQLFAMFAPMVFFVTIFVFDSIFTLLLAIASWVPVIYLVWYFFLGRHLTSNRIGSLTRPLS